MRRARHVIERYTSVAKRCAKNGTTTDPYIPTMRQCLKKKTYHWSR